ncbi:MAG: hypothetical protein RLZZ427_881 [Pseudomonadota bacterium]|jgi:hypothetical protein
MTLHTPSKPATDSAWFAPKRLGYGAGLPLVWQGWAMLVVHLLIGVAVYRTLSAAPELQKISVLLVTILPLPLYAAKTRGGWKWRWGED